jgi:hypothetical protein
MANIVDKLRRNCQSIEDLCYPWTEASEIPQATRQVLFYVGACTKLNRDQVGDITI